MAPRLLITGGGTGGHVSPGLGVAGEWQKRHGDGTVAWVGKPGGIEAGMAGRAGLTFHPVTSAALKRQWTFENLGIPAALAKGFFQARALIKAEKPTAVLMTGGYVGLPLSLAAASLGTPLVLMEPNVVPGLANRLLKPLAYRLCLAYGEDNGNSVVTGTPCRLGTLPEQKEARQAMGLEAGRRTLLVMPGSQAARAINAALAEALPALADRKHDWQWIWMCGPQALEACQAAAQKASFPIQVHGFIDDVAAAYAAADLVLCRSGASTLAELGVAAKPSLQVPFPYATGDHQRANARGFAEAGAACVLDERDLSAARLEKELRALLDDDVKRKAMQGSAAALGRPQAAASVADVLEQSAGLR